MSANIGGPRGSGLRKDHCAHELRNERVEGVTR